MRCGCCTEKRGTEGKGHGRVHRNQKIKLESAEAGVVWAESTVEKGEQATKCRGVEVLFNQMLLLLGTDWTLGRWLRGPTAAPAQRAASAGRPKNWRHAAAPAH